jgi:hypothetical protein
VWRDHHQLNGWRSMRKVLRWRVRFPLRGPACLLTCFIFNPPSPTPPPALTTSLCHEENTRGPKREIDGVAFCFKCFYPSLRRGYSIRSRVLAANGTPTLPLARLSTLLTRPLSDRWAENEAQPSPIPTWSSAYPDTASMYR